MSTNSFFDSQTTWKAYLGKHALDLLNLTSSQAAVIYEERGLVIPLEVSSTLQLLHRQGVLSIAEVAKALDLPHQLAAQRVAKLTKLRLVRRKPDPNDGRRVLLHLTKTGQEQAAILVRCMADVAELYDALFEEIGCDLSEKIPAATAALRATPLHERMLRRATKSADRQTTRR